MSRRQRQGKGGYDHGAHKGWPDHDLWGARPLSGQGKTSTNKYWCRRIERARAVVDLRDELKRIGVILA